MPNFRQHLAINATALSLLEFIVQLREIDQDPTRRFDWGRLVANVALGTVAGALPDLLEPSFCNPNHRGFWHSFAAAGLVWWLASGRHTDQIPPEIRKALKAFGAGYSLHLGTDLLFTKAKGIGVVCSAL